jgi:hypothetical protein
MPPESIRQAHTKHSDTSSGSTGPARDWLHARARLMPDLLSQSPPWVRGVFDHSWSSMRALLQQVSQLPPQLWSQLLSWESGYAVICTGDSRYVPGPASIRRRQLINIAFVSVEDLAAANERPLHVLGHLIDHHLGCGGDAEGPWLSESGGTPERWRQVGQRLPELYALGHAIDPVARSGVRDYFAQSLALYCLDRQRLNVADPLIYKWLRTTLWDEAFWKTED